MKKLLIILCIGILAACESKNQSQELVEPEQEQTTMQQEPSSPTQEQPSPAAASEVSEAPLEREQPSISQMPSSSAEGLIVLPKKDQLNSNILGASKAGDVEKLKKIFEAIQDDTIRFFLKYDAALSEAAANGSVEIVRFLLDKNKDKALSMDYNAALAMAVVNEHPEIADLLKTAGATVNRALIKAVAMGNVPAVKALLQAGADANVKDEEGNTALVEAAIQEKARKDELFNRHIDYAAENKKYAEIAKLLLDAGADVNLQKERTFFGECAREQKTVTTTALAEAVENQNDEMIYLLLAKGANVNEETDHRSPLLTAVKKRNKKIASLLIAKGADVNDSYCFCEGDCGAEAESVLQEILAWGDQEMLDLLLAHGVDISRPLDCGCDIPSLWPLSMVGTEQTLRRFLQQGADVKAKDASGCITDALASAAARGDIEIVKILLAAGIDVNAACWYYEPALIQAIDTNQPEIVKLLLEAGASLNPKDKFGDPVLALARAIENGQAEIVQLLLDAGADVNLADNDGKTPLKYATKSGHTEIIELLKSAGAKE